MATLRHLALLGAALVLMGGHWGVLQGIAWTSMAVSYSQDVGWEEGLKRTFSGTYPCTLCESIQQAKEQESEKSPAISLHAKKAEIATPLRFSFALDPKRSLLVLTPASHTSFSSRNHPPDSPVPRISA